MPEPTQVRIQAALAQIATAYLQSEGIYIADKARKSRARPSQADLTRALKAAQKAGVDARIEIDFDGKMVVIASKPRINTAAASCASEKPGSRPI